MFSRREILRATALAGLPVPIWAGPEPTSAGLPLTAFTTLHDAHEPAARLFGAALVDQGVATHTLGDDVTPLWLSTLRPLWRRAPAPVIGLTTPAVLFCLEQLAWAHGLRVVFHAEHAIQSHQPVQHRILRGDKAVPLAPELAASGALWPGRLAARLAARPPDPGVRPGASLAGLLPALPAHTRLLTSWVIAAA